MTKVKLNSLLPHRDEMPINFVCKGRRLKRENEAFGPCDNGNEIFFLSPYSYNDWASILPFWGPLQGILLLKKLKNFKREAMGM